MACVKLLCVLMCLQVVLCQIEKCKTYVGKVGSCVPISDCEPFLKVLPQARINPAVKLVMQKSKCGFESNVPKVCCPLSVMPVPATTGQLPATTASPPLTTILPPFTTINPNFRTIKPPSIQPPTTIKPPLKTLNTTQSITTPTPLIAPGDYITAFPKPPVCGVSNATYGRIVDGVNATLGDFPWIALLGYRGHRGQPTDWRCGGSLISSHHVLTAAHCIHKFEDDLFVVRLGELDLTRDDDGAFPIDVLIKTQIKHEEYSPTSFTNDIGVLVLERNVEFTDSIHPICLPVEDELRARNFVDYSPVVAGWGQIKYHGPSASHLQVVQLPVVTNEYCIKAYAPYNNVLHIDDRALCAGFEKGGKDTCQGDSGGPLMQPIWDPKIFKSYYYQIGVVSLGRRCGDVGFPGIYTRVTSFIPWLQKVVLGAKY